VIEHLVCALFFCQAHALLRPRGSKDGHAHGTGKLCSGRANASAGPMDQHGFTGPRLCMMNNGGDGSRIGNPYSRSLGEGIFSGSACT